MIKTTLNRYEVKLLSPLQMNAKGYVSKIVLVSSIMIKLLQLFIPTTVS